MRYEQFMAMRYLSGAQGREEGRTFLRFITYISVGGVTIGVAALLLALSIVRGFSQEIQRKVTGFGAHVQVENYQDAPLSQSDTLQHRLVTWSHVERVDPVVLEFVLLRSAQEIDGVGLWGTEQGMPFIRDQLVAGTFSFDADAEQLPGVVIGRQLSRLLGADVGDRVTAFSMRQLGGSQEEASVFARPRVRQFHVAGIYETGLANFDELYAFTDIAVARQLVDYRPDQVSRFDLTLDDVRNSRAVADAIEAEFGFPILARSIYQVYRNLFAWVDLQQSIIPVVIGIIVIVAAFNIIGTLLMVILEKTREIGILLSMGTSARAVRQLFLWLGIMIGGLGVAFGSSLALVLALLQIRYEIIPLPQEAYYMATAPIALHPLDFVLVGGVTLLLCALAAFVPARVASRIDPIRSIRFAA